MPGGTTGYFCQWHEALTFYQDESRAIAFNPVLVKCHVNGNVGGTDPRVVFDFFQKLV